MKLMEYEIKPSNQINSFVLVNEFVAVLKVYGPSLLQIIHSTDKHGYIH